MKKSIWIFLLAVLLPSVVLGWLALRSAEEQQIILERRTAQLYQKEADVLAGAARTLIDDERRTFAETVRKLLAAEKPEQLAKTFAAKLASAWERKAVGFALGKEGNLLSPSAQGARTNPDWQKFLLNNSAFLSSTMAAQVYWVSAEELSRPEQMRKMRNGNESNGNNKLSLEIQPIVQANKGAQPYTGEIHMLRQAEDRPSPGATGTQDQQILAPSPSPAMVDNLSKGLAERQNDPSIRSDESLAKKAQIAPVPEAVEDPRHNGLPGSVKLQGDPVGLELSNRRAGTAKDAAKPKPEAPTAPTARLSDGLSNHLETLLQDKGKDATVETGTASTRVVQNLGTAGLTQDSSSVFAYRNSSAPQGAAVDNQYPGKQEAALRNVAPQRVLEDNGRALSQLMPATAEFNALTTGSDEGVVTRFVQDQLEIIFWMRPPQARDLIFGCLVQAESLRDLWANALPPGPSSRLGSGVPEFVLALLDDRARPVATRPAGETARDWKRPFVAAEIGEALPHWEAALYLQRPQQLEESARSVRRTLKFLVSAALGAIACGGWLVVADARRQLALAQQKADFVSNVSHELKTPLTSIRMFAELMQNDRNSANPKHPQYLRIIMVEAERLTRLINNVLDFAGLERRQKRFEKRPLDLHAVVERTWESHELHLQENGFVTSWQAAAGPYPVLGDADALAQVLVNLLSNAEKYCGDCKEVTLHTYLDGGDVCVSVLDRGTGVPSGEERKIFDSFYRAHDSLSSGIQGSGLGLTLAQRVAAEHGASIIYQPREGGGSNFTLRIPLDAARVPS